jgi:hypothetical protein
MPASDLFRKRPTALLIEQSSQIYEGSVPSARICGVDASGFASDCGDVPGDVNGRLRASGAAAT